MKNCKIGNNKRLILTSTLYELRKINQNKISLLCVYVCEFGWLFTYRTTRKLFSSSAGFE